MSEERKPLMEEAKDLVKRLRDKESFENKEPHESLWRRLERVLADAGVIGQVTESVHTLLDRNISRFRKDSCVSFKIGETKLDNRRVELVRFGFSSFSDDPASVSLTHDDDRIEVEVAAGICLDMLAEWCRKEGKL